jgi:hypothetical protein
MTIQESVPLRGSYLVGSSDPRAATESAREELHGISQPDQTAVSERSFLPVDPVITKEADAVLKPHRTILDTPTPESGQIVSPFKTTLSRVSRRLYSRCILGLKIPGRYYFITWTSSPQSPPIEKSWRALRKWLKRYRPKSAHCYCITNEGFGVIHMILRLGKREKRMDVNEVRAHWVRLHKANQIKIKHVPESMKNNLAAYLGDQRAKRSLGGEMAWQDGIVRWRWSKGWLPQGFTKAFGRVWWSLMDISPGLREKAVCDWLNACHANDAKIKAPPKLAGKEIIYPEIPEFLITQLPDPLVEFDRNLKKNVKLLTSKEVKNTLEEDDLTHESGIILQKWKKKYECRNIRVECADYNAISERRFLEDIDRKKVMA